MKARNVTNRQRRGLTNRQRHNVVGYLFMSPFLISFFLFTIIPVVTAIVLSLTNYNMIETPQFIGLSNYRLLLMDDSEFITGLKNTFVFALISGPLSFLGSFVMAVLINNLKRFRNLFSLLFYAPTLVSGVAISVVWLYFFNGDRYGLINNFLIRLGVISDPIQWTSNTGTVLWVVIIVSVWTSMGVNFLTFLAGLQNVSQDMYEAGKIDGIKNGFQELIYLTFPVMKPQLLFATINMITGAFGVFDIAVSIAGMPSPDYAAHTIVTHLYDYGFIRFEMGYASAIAVILFLISYLAGRLFTRVLRED